MAVGDDARACRNGRAKRWHLPQALGFGDRNRDRDKDIDGDGDRDRDSVSAIVARIDCTCLNVSGSGVRAWDLEQRFRVWDVGFRV